MTRARFDELLPSWGDRWAALVFGDATPTAHEARLMADLHHAQTLAVARREIARGWRLRALRAEARLKALGLDEPTTEAQP